MIGTTRSIMGQDRSRRVERSPCLVLSRRTSEGYHLIRIPLNREAKGTSQRERSRVISHLLDLGMFVQAGLTRLKSLGTCSKPLQQGDQQTQPMAA